MEVSRRGFLSGFGAAVAVTALSGAAEALERLSGDHLAVVDWVQPLDGLDPKADYTFSSFMERDGGTWRRVHLSFRPTAEGKAQIYLSDLITIYDGRADQFAVLKMAGHTTGFGYSEHGGEGQLVEGWNTTVWQANGQNYGFCMQQLRCISPPEPFYLTDDGAVEVDAFNLKRRRYRDLGEPAPTNLLVNSNELNPYLIWGKQNKP